MQPKIILMQGLPGVGKTVLAHEIAKRLHIAIVSIDTIKAVIYRKVPKSKLGTISYSIAENIMKENISSGISMVFDSVGLYKKTLQSAIVIAHGTKNILTVRCVCDENTWKKHLRKKTRLPFQKKSSIMPHTTLKPFTSKYTLTVDSTAKPDANAKIVSKFLHKHFN